MSVWSDRATELDARDPLAAVRAEFCLPKNTVYLDGNSLGALPRSAAERVQRCITDEWGESLIRSWNDHGWWDKAAVLGDRLGRLIGSDEGQTLITDNLSVNLYKAMLAAARMRTNRPLIVADRTAFPSDLYVLEGVVSQLPNNELIITPNPEATRVLLKERGAEVAVVLFNHVDFKSSQILDMKTLTAEVQAVGALTVWDLAHSIGAMPVHLDDCHVDFAIGCTYKYINGGPGAPGFIYVAAKHQDVALQPISGWWGHSQPFAFETEFVAAKGMARFATGTQPILSMVALEASLDIWSKVDLDQLEDKYRALSTLFIDTVLALGAEAGILDQLHLGSPADATQRGSHVVFANDNGFPVMRALIASGVIGDFREPKLLRFGFAPLYNTFSEVVRAATELVDILANRRWDKPEFHVRGAVT